MKKKQCEAFAVCCRPEVATDPERTRISVFFFRIRNGSASSFIKRCETGPDPDLNLALPLRTIRRQNQHFWSSPEFWQKNRPSLIQFWVKTVFFGYYLNFGRKKRPNFG